MSATCPHCLDAPAFLPAGAVDWLKTGERGVSSEAIFSHLTGIPIGGNWMSPPYDSADFMRCRKLLVAVPSFASRIGEMATVSPQWAAIVARWRDIDDISNAPDAVCALITKLLANAERQRP